MTKVLIVEDSPTQAQALKLILEGEGFQVAVARNGAEALALLPSASFDLIVSDVLMPDLSGYELCRKVKSDVNSKDIPFILLTSLNDPLDIIKGLECGADNYVTKPYESQVLLDRVLTILENRRARADGKFRVGVNVLFLGKQFTITSDKEQILDLLVSAIDDVVRANRQFEAKQAELVAAQTKLKEYASRTEEKYRALMANAQDAVLVLDSRGRIEEANRQAQTLLGRTPEQLTGSDCSELVAAADRDVFKAMLAKLQAGAAARVEDLRVLGPAGQERWTDCAASSVSIEGERSILLIARDVTERKAADRQLRQSQRLEAVGRLAGGVAHDFNNLLTAISGYSGFLLEALPPGDPNRADVEEVKKAGDRAAALTRQLLAFSRQQVLQPLPLDVNAVIRDLEKMFRRLIGADIELAFDLDGRLATINADRGQIEQVIMNLVLNARDALPTGGRIELSSRNAELDPAFVSSHPGAAEGPHVLLSVRDNGRGMDQETISHIFEPFFTTKEQGKGTGLGLATVYGIVKQSGGSLFVESAPGQGAAFSIYLPAVRQPAAPAEDPSAPEASSGTETILLVEDDEMVRKFAQRALRQSGYTLLEASDPLDALKRCDQHDGKIDLLLTDIVMPQMRGTELAEIVRRRFPEIATVFMSGYTEESLVHERLAAGGASFLQKPMTIESLAKAVRQALDRRAR